MKATRGNLPYLIAAAGGALLFLFLFIGWLGGGGDSASAWTVFSFADIVLAILAILAVVIAGARVVAIELPVAQLRPELLKWIGAIALTITLTLLIELTSGRSGVLDIEVGGYVAILASLAILAGAILAERPDLNARLADAAGVGDEGRPAAVPPASPPAASPGAGEPASAVQPATGAGGAAAGAASASAASAGSEPVQSSGPPAGWYPDPQGQARLRYWDGTVWTEQTSA